MIDRIISRLLWMANSNPRVISSESFYALKTEILHRFGTRDGYDHQQIDHECWDCQQWGWNDCPKCGGSGIFRSTRTALIRWRLGRRVFHEPTSQVPFNPLGVNIRGYVKHQQHPEALGAQRLLWWLSGGSMRLPEWATWHAKTYPHRRLVFPRPFNNRGMAVRLMRMVALRRYPDRPHTLRMDGRDWVEVERIQKAWRTAMPVEIDSEVPF